MDPGSDGQGGDEEGGRGGTTSSPPPPETGPAPGTESLRRLTQSQYRSAVRDLLGVDATEVPLPSDGVVEAFTSNAGLSPSLLQVDQYAAAAETLAARAVMRLEALSSCTTADEACARLLVNDLGARAFRRPLEPVDVEGLLAVYAAGRVARDHKGAVALVLEALLQAPEFLYQVERGLGAGSARRRLSGYEVAAKMSFLLWDTLPDAGLVASAAQGGLDAPDGIAREARRLLADVRARSALARFHREWLGLGNLPTLIKDTTRYPFFDDGVRAALGAETDAFVDFVTRKGDGRLGTLLSAPVSFLSKPLFRIYGMVEPPMHDPATAMGLQPGQRAGILTQPAVLATHAHADITSPVHRGLFVFKNVLCGEMPPPPENVDTTPIRSDSASGLSRREAFARHEADPACGSCHRIFDPIGFAFENYDALGAYRTVDADEQKPVDATASVRVGLDVDGDVDGALGLIERMARSRDVHDCYARQWWRYTRGRKEAKDEESGELAALASSFAASSGDIADLLVAIVSSEDFRTRSNPEPKESRP